MKEPSVRKLLEGLEAKAVSSNKIWTEADKCRSLSFGKIKWITLDDAKELFSAFLAGQAAREAALRELLKNRPRFIVRSTFSEDMKKYLRESNEWFGVFTKAFNGTFFLRKEPSLRELYESFPCLHHPPKYRNTRDCPRRCGTCDIGIWLDEFTKKFPEVIDEAFGAKETRGEPK